MSELTSLPLFHNIKGQSVLVLGDGEMAEPKRRLVERAGGIVEDDLRRAIEQSVRIAFIAYDDAKTCEAAAIELRRAGMIVNVVDRPDLCDFTTPSILDRNPVLIAVGTGGASAGLAKHVRLRLERILPQSLGKLAKRLFAARSALRKSYPDSAARRRALDEALREGGVLDAFEAQSEERVEDWAKGKAKNFAGRSESFAVTSDDPDDLTLKQARLLGEADTVCTDTQISSKVLARARADAVRITCQNSPECRVDPCPLADRAGFTVVLKRSDT